MNPPLHTFTRAAFFPLGIVEAFPGIVMWTTAPPAGGKSGNQRNDQGPLYAERAGPVLLLLLLFNKNWSIVNLQCCVSFRCIASVLFIYIYIYFFRFFPIIGYYKILSRVPCAIH